MAKALGIGGVFFRARDPAALAAWYQQHLGVAAGEAPWQTEAGPTVFAPFKADTDYFPPGMQWMINFRVDDLKTLIAQLRAAGIDVETRPDWVTPYGDFARIHDPEGTPIELWQAPPATT
jgi:glyoxylase I family protein